MKALLSHGVSILRERMQNTRALPIDAASSQLCA
jgi:hypothetical protein